MKYIINPFPIVIGWTGIGLFSIGHMLMTLSDGIRR